MDALTYIQLPLLECLVLVGIHSYLGIHVIRRKVIFVDLALAQLAALGATVGFLFGIMPETPAALIFSIIFVGAGAAVFATTRMRSERIPHEAVIGLVYAIAAALAILVIDKAPSGAEHLKNVLVGRIEWVLGHEVLTAAIVYAVVGIVHWLFRKPFFLISEDPEQAFARGMRVRAWDFLFYLTFGVVISISVKVAGVLLVFVFLVVPAIAAVLITDNRLHQLLIGWAMGALVSAVGMMVSYHAALPSGPTVVAVYGAALVVVALVVYIWRSSNRRRATGLVIAGAAATVAFVGALALLGDLLKHSSLGASEHHHTHHLYDEHEQDHHGSAADEHHDGEAVVEAADPEAVIATAEARLAGADRGATLRALLAIVRDPDSGLIYQEQALAIIEGAAGRKFAVDLEGEPEVASDSEIAAWIRSQ